VPPMHTRASRRLLRDLAVVGRMQQDQPTAAERVESLLGIELADILRTSLADATGGAHGARPRRAA
jgi:hypothetical protein